MASNIVCKCGPAFSQNLFTILGMLLVLTLVVRFFSKTFVPEVWDKISPHLPSFDLQESSQQPSQQLTQQQSQQGEQQADQRYSQQQSLL